MAENTEKTRTAASGKKSLSSTLFCLCFVSFRKNAIKKCGEGDSEDARDQLCGKMLTSSTSTGYQE